MSERTKQKSPGAGDAGIQIAMEEVRKLIESHKLHLAKSLLQEMLIDFEQAEVSQTVAPLISKWNKRYPNEVTLGTRLANIHFMRNYGELLLKQLGPPYGRFSENPDVTFEQEQSLLRIAYDIEEGLAGTGFQAELQTAIESAALPNPLPSLRITLVHGTWATQTAWTKEGSRLSIMRPKKRVIF